MSRTRKHTYTGSKRFSSGCRCHGSCSYCRNNRLYADRKHRTAADEQLRDARNTNQD